MRKKVKELSRENLQKIILEMSKLLSKEQYDKLEALIDSCMKETSQEAVLPTEQRMSQELVDEKMKEIKGIMQRIDEGELYLDIEEYEDYSNGYWGSEWIIEYYDNQGIGQMLTAMIQFAKECVDDRRYPEANDIYEWLWEMNVSTESEYDCDCEAVDLEVLSEEKIIHTDMKYLALLTLYVDYQIQEPHKRAEDMYLYFSNHTFQKLHMEDMFSVGREKLSGEAQFWKDWITLLKTKMGEAEGRLLKEAVLYSEGLEGLLELAEENSDIHPSLYLEAMKEYEKKHDYFRIEEIGEKALEKIDSKLKIRSEIARKAAYAASYLSHMENVMRFCWESFRSDSTDKNFLRLFGLEEMAEKYGMRGQEILSIRQKGNSVGYTRNTELLQNTIWDDTYYSLNFYMGNFDKARKASKNPQGSLGWSGSFIRYGIRLFLLYLYVKPLPSKAASAISDYVGFSDETDLSSLLSFEGDILEESRNHKISTFWNYFQRWKRYFPMPEKEKEKYFIWAEKIVYSRADAIVSGQHRGHYGAVAELLAMVAEIKEDMGVKGAGRMIFAEYKRKFPRHSSFQAEMKNYFGELINL